MGKRKKTTMLFEEILDKYQEMVKKEIPKRELPREEKVIIMMMCISTVIFLARMRYLDSKNKVFSALIALFVYILLMSVIIWRDECSYKKTRNQRKELYKERLKALEYILRKAGICTIEKIDMIIVWCDDYSKMDGVWVKELKTVGNLFGVVILSTVIWGLEEVYTKTNGTRNSILGILVIMIILRGIITYVIFPSFKEHFNHKHRQAAEMKADLTLLKFQKLN